MLALQAGQIFAPTATSTEYQGEVTVARDGAVAQRVEHLDIERIVGRRGDLAVEREIGLAGRLAELEQPLELEEGLLDRASCAALRRMRRKAGALDLDAHAHFEHVDRLADLVADLVAERAEGERRMLEHEDAGALPRFDQPVGGERWRSLRGSPCG